MKIKVVFFLFLFLSLKVASQVTENFKSEALAEKIYLQLDNTVYASDKTVWFKVVLANAASHNLKITSGVLYVDIINDANKIIDSKMLKITNGIGKGYFDLDRTYKDGTYQIRAYTQWNKNFGENFITTKTIQIFSNKTKDYLLNTDEGVTINRQKEAKEKLKVSIQFFPEGGKIIENLPIKIGYKATDNNGKGVVINGDILNDKNEVLTHFKTNKVGLGFFELDNPTLKESLKARVLNSDGQTYVYYNLPEIYQIGYTLSVMERRGVLVVGIRTNVSGNPIINLKASVRGRAYFEEEAQLIDGKYIFSIPKSKLPEGVVVFQLSSQQGQTISERLYFNQLPEQNIEILAELTKTQFNKRETVDLDLTIKNSKTINNQEIISSSVLVLNKSLFEDILIKRDNLLSFFLLTSDIKGKIEMPGNYFIKDTSLDIDCLMLTQGWRNYKYVSPRGKLNYKLEKGLRLKGVINVNKRNPKKENLNIIMTTLGDDYSIYSGNVMVPGSFDFQIEDLFGDEKKMIFKPAGLDEKESENYRITLSELKKMEPNYKSSEPKKRIIKDSILAAIISENRIQSEKRKNYFMNFNGVTELDEVIVDAYKMTPKRKEMFDKYGSPDVVIDGEDIQEQTNNYSTGLYSNLIAFRDKVYIERDRRGNYSAKTLKGGKGHVHLVVVDGIPVNKDNYFLIQKIEPSEVTSFEIIDNPARARQLYASVFGNYPYGEFQASIIAIYTEAGKGIFGALDFREGEKIYSIPVFSGEKEFYIPNHSEEESYIDSEPDLRTTIYWNPDVKLSIQESSKLKFSHSDDIGKFLVIIEAISESGLIGYKTFEYSVSDTQN